MSELSCLPWCARMQAYHFCKRGDARRQDLVRMVKTLAYQLGTTVPKLQVGLSCCSRFLFLGLPKVGPGARTASD